MREQKSSASGSNVQVKSVCIVVHASIGPYASTCNHPPILFLALSRSFSPFSPALFFLSLHLIDRDFLSALLRNWVQITVDFAILFSYYFLAFCRISRFLDY